MNPSKREQGDGTAEKMNPLQYRSGRVQEQPAIFITDLQEAKLVDNLKLALIGRLYGGRTTLQQIREFFSGQQFEKGIQVGHIDKRHVLIRFQSEENFKTVWAKGSWFIHGHRIRVSKWSPDFTTNNPLKVASAWMALPHLPLHMFDKDLLFSIAKSVGTPIKIDNATSTLSRPNCARVAIQIDFEKKLPHQIWIEKGNVGFWQRVVFEQVPNFCSCCQNFGHSELRCRKKEITVMKTKGTNNDSCLEKGNLIPKSFHKAAEMNIREDSPTKELPEEKTELAQKTASTGGELINFNSAKMEDHYLIQDLKPLAIVPPTLPRCESSPLLRIHWLDEKLSEPELFDNEPHGELLNGVNGQRDNINVQVHFEGQVFDQKYQAHTPVKTNRYNLRSLLRGNL